MGGLLGYSRILLGAIRAWCRPVADILTAIRKRARKPAVIHLRSINTCAVPMDRSSNPAWQ